VHPSTAKRIAAAVDQIGFRRNQMARALKTGDRTSTIALVVEDLGNPFFTAVASAVETVAIAHGCRLFVASSEESPERERDIVLDLLGRRVDGIVLVPTSADHRWLRREVERGTPIVCINRPAPGLQLDTVVLANDAGATRAVRKLTADGHLRVGLLGDAPTIWTMRQRQSGYKRALRLSGIPFDAALVSYQARTPEQAAAQLRVLQALPDPPTAVFCMNNRSTLGVILELGGSGGRIAVAGFDDLEVAALAPFPLVLVSYQINDMGQRAAQLLFDRIDGGVADPVTIVLPVALREVGASFSAVAAH